ncbi:MAG: polyphosphate kinase 1 [Tissierellia bacterium]|nr:polyphosphate kinase 1 [Tissierellia bacterium]
MKLQDIARNRELSWLKFNERVLVEALDDIPLLEKLKFVSIFMSNLEEFYMVRVGSLTDKTYLKQEYVDRKSGWNAKEQLDRIFVETKRLLEKKDRIHKKIGRELRKKSIYELSMEELSPQELSRVERHYERYVEPILSPQVIDQSHPFPFLQNNEFYIATMVTKKTKARLALVRVPAALDPIFVLEKEDGFRYVRTENMVKYFIPRLFEKFEVTSPILLRVTRNADLTVEEELDMEDGDFRDCMKKILKKRKRLQAVRVLVDQDMPKDMERILKSNLNVHHAQIFTMETAMDLRYVFDWKRRLPKELWSQLTFKEFRPHKSADIDSQRSLIDQIQEKERLFIYPYEDMSHFLDLLEEASTDPRVLSIKMTIYRLSEHSKVVSHLIRAAENGKDVTVLMELRARFDEQNNIDYSETLYDAGCNIIYGIPGFKVHSKICLITYRDGKEIRTITQVGTGNYNENTSKLYTDISYMTGDKALGEDGENFFRNMSLGHLDGTYQMLKTSPHGFKSMILSHMDREISKGEEGFVFCKFNSLSDEDCIMKLAACSEARVDVKLIIRGICCIQPGIPGRTDHMEIRSIVGRFLEHARVYIFGRGEDRVVYISSADLMTRNTQRRVEIATPIENPRLQEKILEYMDAQWKDNVKGRYHGATEDYMPIVGQKHFSSQEYYMRKAEEEDHLPVHHTKNGKFWNRIQGLWKKIWKRI